MSGSKYKQLNCGKTSSQKLAWDNVVCVHKDDAPWFGLPSADGLPVWVDIKTERLAEPVVYELRIDDGAMKGELGMNLLQQDKAGVTSGVPVEVRVFQCPSKETLLLAT